MGIWTSLSQTEVIIISASCGGALLLILIVLVVLYRRYHTAKARLVHELGGNPGEAIRSWYPPIYSPHTDTEHPRNTDVVSHLREQ